MSEFRLSDAAKRDVADIWNYIAADNHTAADKLLDTFFDTFERLASSPLIGQRRPEFGTDGLRVFPVGNYAVFYRPYDFGIEIARVVHATRDFLSLSFN